MLAAGGRLMTLFSKAWMPTVAWSIAGLLAFFAQPARAEPKVANQPVNLSASPVAPAEAESSSKAAPTSQPASDIAAKESLHHLDCGIEAKSSMHCIAYITVEEKLMKTYRDALLPHRGELVK